MSVEALSWLAQRAPDVKPHWMGTLFGLCNHADDLGKGSRPSQDTLAWYARKDERNVRRDLEAMEEAGLIRKGDQRLVAHLPPDKRPVVWDLAMERTRGPRPGAGKPGRPTKNRGGADVPPVDDEKRGGADVRPDAEGKTGGALAPNRGGADVRQTFPEPSGEPSPPLGEAERPDADAAQEPQPPGAAELTADERALSYELARARPGWSPVSIRRVLASPEIRERTDRELVRLAFLIAAEDRGTRTPYRLLHDACPAWARAERELYPREAAALAGEVPLIGVVPWCGQRDCDRVTRTGVDPDTDAPLPGRPRCPRCHPQSPAVQP